MKNRRMVPQALVSLVLVLGLIIPAPIVGASPAVSHGADEESVMHAPVDSSRAPSATTLNTPQTQATPMVAAGCDHTLGLRSDGSVVAAGPSPGSDHGFGQCDVGGWMDAVQIAAGCHHTVGLRSDGSVVAVGANHYGQCNVGSWTNIVHIGAGIGHTVGLKSDGTVVAVGPSGGSFFDYGQCNTGSWTNIVQVAAGYHHTVGLKSDGTVVAVGANSDGQRNVDGWTSIIQVATGYYHTVGLRSDGTVVAVGWNDHGQCNVGGWTNIIQVSAGGEFTVGLKSDGTVVAAGPLPGSQYDCGQGDVGAWVNIVQVAAGSYHTVGLKSDGTVVAVGWNDYGQCNVADWNLGETAPKTGLADSPWPKFRHDAQNTGRSPYLGPEVPELKWSFLTGDSVRSSPAIGADGTIYVGSYDHRVYAINPDGTQKWSFTTGGPVVSSPAVGTDETIYVGSDNRLYAMNLDGTEKWSFPTGSWVNSSPAIGTDGTVYVGSQDGKLYAVNLNGTEKWSFSMTGGVCVSSPAIGADGTIYVTSYVDSPDNLYAIGPDGTEKWRFPAGGESSTTIGADGTVYVGSDDHRLCAINPDGTEKWTFTAGDIRSSPAIVADGTIYVGSRDSRLYAINPDGTERWSFSAGGRIDSSPAIGADGTIYVGSEDHRLYAINPDGTEKWSFITGSEIDSSPAIGADGTIYVGSCDGKLYAIGEATPSPDAPIASALDISGQRKVMYPDEPYTVTAKYFDPDGREDLKYCYLQLNHPEKPLTMMWVQAIDQFWIYAGELGVNYLKVSGNSTPITEGGLEGYQLAWTFNISDQWPEVENAIDFGVYAWDDSDLKDGWHYDDTKASFRLSTPSELTISPKVAVVKTGESQTYIATATDSCGAISDVTAETVFSIDTEAGGSWAGNTYTSEVAGEWTVTGTYMGSTDKAALTVEPSTWSFAVITDLHIGRGYLDYGGPGSGSEDWHVEGQDYYLTERLHRTVDWIIQNQDSYDLKFVVVLGDISDSGEYSELKKAKGILDRLNDANIPYVPVMGNHDIWPYTDKDEFKNLRYFEFVFKEQFERLTADPRISLIKQSAGWAHDPSDLQNYAFDYGDIRFVILDFVPRSPASGGAKGVGFHAVLWDSTLLWLTQNLEAGRSTVILAHHPLVCPDGGFFDPLNIVTISEAIKISDADVQAAFGGHLHGYYDSSSLWRPLLPFPLGNPLYMDANTIYSTGLGTPEGVPVVTTEALMVASNEPTAKGIVRIVRAEDGQITIPLKVEGEFPAFNPHFKEVDVELRPALGWPPYKWVIEVEAYAFTKLFSHYTLHIDGEKVGSIDGASWLDAVQFEHDYEGDKCYDFSLTVKGHESPWSETISETRCLSCPHWIVGAFSPVDIVITDPDGLVISKQRNEMPGARYIEQDFNGDGNPDDVITMRERKIGDYLVAVTPEAQAAPTDTYTLVIWSKSDEETVILANNVQVSDIAAQPYIIRSTETGVTLIVPAVANFAPETLNLQARGQWITAYVELPQDYAAEDIDIDTVHLLYKGYELYADWGDAQDGILTAKFDWATVAGWSEGLHDQQVELTVVGEVNGIGFQGTATIRVIDPPRPRRGR